LSQSEFQRGEHEHLPYRLWVPKLATQAKGPLIVFLHGVGERGSDNEAQIAYPFFSDPLGLLSPKTLAARSAFVVAPQVPLTDKWIEIERWSDPAYRHAAKPTQALARVSSLIDALLAAHPIDEKRLYLVGLSMGAYGVYDLVVRRPGQFAGAVAVCGRADLERVSELKKTPFFIAHGAHDKLVSVDYSRDLVKALRKAGSPPKYIEYPVVGHDAWTKALTDQTLIDWLFAQER
jgi:predicted peptidase